MKQAKISDLKNNLSRYLDLVRNGEVIQVLNRNTPVATIMGSPPGRSGEKDEELLARMERKGLVRRGNVRLIQKILDDPLHNGNSGVLEALLDERQEGM